MAKRKKRRSPARNSKGHFVKKGARRRKSTSGRRKTYRRKSRPSGARSAAGYTVGNKPIRRRKLNPRGRRRLYRRNPINFRGGIMGIVNNQIIPAAIGAGGALALNLALSFIPLPDVAKTGWARHGVRLLGALGLGWAAQKFVGGKKGEALAAGALTIVMYDIVRAALSQFAPEISTRLGEFEDVSLGEVEYYSPASYVQPVAALPGGSPGDGNVDGFGAYMNGDLDGDLDGVGMGAYMNGDI